MGIADSRRNRAATAARKPTVVDPNAVAAEAQATDIKYGEGAAGQQLAEAAKADAQKQGKRIVEQLTARGFTQGPEFERAATLAVHGIDPDLVEEPWLAKAGKALSWLDKPGALVRFGIADILGLDTKAGTEFTMDDFKDIWGGNTASIIARHGEDVVGKEGRLGGQAMLDIAGYELAEKEGTVGNWLERNFHGLVSLGVELVTDPLTYATGGASAVGKKASISAADALTTKVMAKVGTHLLAGADDAVLGGLERTLAVAARKEADDLIKVAMKKADNVLAPGLEEAVLKEAVAKVGRKQFQEVGEALANRDYGALSSEFVDYAKTEGKSWLTGGIRITPKPLGRGGVQVPGTRGLGRKITKTIFGTHVQSTAKRGALGRQVGERLGTGLRGKLDSPALHMTSRWRNLFDSIDADKNVVRAFQEGKPTAVDMWALQRNAPGLVRKTQLKAIGGDIANSGQKLTRAMKEAGLRDEPEKVYFRGLIGNIQDGRLFSESVPSSGHAALDEAAEEFVGVWRQSFEDLHRIARDSGMEIGHIEDYIPLVRSKETNRLFEAMQDAGVAVSAPADASEEVLRAYQLLSEMYGAWVRRSNTGRKALGTFENAQERVLGQQLALNDMGDVTLLQDAIGSGKIEFLDHVTLNTELSAAMQDVANRARIPLRQEGFNALEMDPFEIANKYMNSMHAAINESIIIKEGKRLGLIKSATFETDLGRLAAQVQEQLGGLTTAGKKRIENTTVNAYEQADVVRQYVINGAIVPPARKVKLVGVRVGDEWLYVPEHVLPHKRVQQAIKQAQRKAQAKYTNKAAMGKDIKARMKALKKQGLPDPVAQQMAEESVFDDVKAIWREVAAAEREDAANQSAAMVEVLARRVAEVNADAATLKGTRAAEMAAHYEAQAVARKGAEDAMARMRVATGTKPQSAIVYDTPETIRAFGEQMKPRVVEKLERLAEQADAIPEGKGRLLAEQFRKIQSALDEVEVFDEEIIMQLDRDLRAGQKLFETIQGGQDLTLTMEEWVRTRPIRRTRMGALEQERVMDEWAELGGTRHVPPVTRVTADPRGDVVEQLARREGMEIVPSANVWESLEGNVRNVKVREARGILQPVEVSPGIFHEPQTGLMWIENAAGEPLAAVRTNPGGKGGMAAKRADEPKGAFRALMEQAEEIDPDIPIKLSRDVNVSDDMADWIQKWALRQPRTDKAAEITTREAWFEGFMEMNGVDLRALTAPDRKKLKVLLQEVPDSPALQAQHMAQRTKILGVETGRPLTIVQKRSLQHMFLDRVESYVAPAGAKRGTRRPSWASIDVDEARIMDPEDFFARYGVRFGEAVFSDTTMKNIADAHNLLYQDQFLGKHLDQALASELRDEFDLLTSLNAGRGVWRDPQKRATLQRVFDESGMSAEYTLRSARSGKFQIESIEMVETLSHTALMRQLKLAGFGTIEAAAEAAADGTLKKGALSKAALNTLANVPQADARALDEMASVLQKTFDGIPNQAVYTADRTLREANRVATLMNRLDDALRKVGPDGQIRAAGLREAEAILLDPVNMRGFRRMLPKDEWPRLDGIKNMIESTKLMRGSDSRVKAILRDSQTLRQDLMFDTVEAKNAIKAIDDELGLARTDKTLAGFEGNIAMMEKLSEIVKSLYGLGEGGAGRWADDAALNTIEKLGKEGEDFARKLGFNDVGDVMQDLKNLQLGKVPTAESEGFVPIVAFGLGGPAVQGKVVQADLGKFMEQTMRTMMAGMTPSGLQGTVRGFRQVLHWWKGMATVARPTFHARNAMSAFWNNSYIDVKMENYAFVTRNIGDLRKAYKVTNDWVKAAEQLADPTASFYFREAALAGLFDSTFARREILSKMQRESVSMGRKLNPLDLEGPLIQGGGWAMERIEDYFRLAAFVRHMPSELIGETDEVMLAAGRTYANDMVNMVHFDYSNLTALEEKIKDFIPFFVWTRRNLPLQMRALVEQPRNMARYNHLIHVGNDMSSSRDDNGPRKYGGSMFIGTDMYLNEDTDGWAQLILDPDIPVKDLFEIKDPLSPASYLNLVVSLLGPQIQEPVKMVFEEQYETTAPAGWAEITRGVKAVFDGDADLNTNPKVSSGTAAMMKLIFPPASEWLTAFEQDPARMQGQGIVEGDLGSRVRAGIMDLTLPGLGVKTSTPHSEYSVYKSSTYETQSILSGLRKEGKITPEMDAFAEEFEKLHPEIPKPTGTRRNVVRAGRPGA